RRRNTASSARVANATLGVDRSSKLSARWVRNETSSALNIPLVVRQRCFLDVILLEHRVRGRHVITKTTDWQEVTRPADVSCWRWLYYHMRVFISFKPSDDVEHCLDDSDKPTSERLELMLVVANLDTIIEWRLSSC